MTLLPNRINFCRDIIKHLPYLIIVISEDVICSYTNVTQTKLFILFGSHLRSKTNTNIACPLYFFLNTQTGNVIASMACCKSRSPA